MIDWETRSTTGEKDERARASWRGLRVSLEYDVAPGIRRPTLRLRTLPGFNAFIRLIIQIVRDEMATASGLDKRPS